MRLRPALLTEQTTLLDVSKADSNLLDEEDRAHAVLTKLPHNRKVAGKTSSEVHLCLGTRQPEGAGHREARILRRQNMCYSKLGNSSLWGAAPGWRRLWQKRLFGKTGWRRLTRYDTEAQSGRGKPRPCT